MPAGRHSSLVRRGRLRWLTHNAGGGGGGGGRLLMGQQQEGRQNTHKTRQWNAKGRMRRWARRRGGWNVCRYWRVMSACACRGGGSLGGVCRRAKGQMHAGKGERRDRKPGTGGGGKGGGARKGWSVARARGGGEAEQSGRAKEPAKGALVKTGGVFRRRKKKQWRLGCWRKGSERRRVRGMLSEGRNAGCGGRQACGV